jgi:hypothetical protein
MPEKKMSIYGFEIDKLIAMTVGEFIEMIADGGRDYVIMKVVAEADASGEAGNRVASLSVLMVPATSLLGAAKSVNCEIFTKKIIALLAAGEGGIKQANQIRKLFPKETSRILLRGSEAEIGNVYFGDN